MSKKSKADAEPKLQADGKQKLTNKEDMKELRKLQMSSAIFRNW